MSSDIVRVLITAGGTRVPLDDIRSITNGSSGRFGARIAEQFMRQSLDKDGCDIRLTYLVAQNAIVPYFKDPIFYCDYFDTYYDYSNKLNLILDNFDFDIILLSAAVSDFGPVETTEGKIESKDEVVIKLKPLPKIIATIRDKAPNAIIVGFKCLSRVSKGQLVEAARKQIEKCNVDLVVANDWNTIKNHEHFIHIVTNDSCHSYCRVKYDHAECVVKECLDTYSKNNA